MLGWGMERSGLSSRRPWQEYLQDKSSFHLVSAYDLPDAMLGHLHMYPIWFSQQSSEDGIIIAPFYRWENWGLVRLNKSLKVCDGKFYASTWLGCGAQFVWSSTSLRVAMKDGERTTWSIKGKIPVKIRQRCLFSPHLLICATTRMHLNNYTE